MLRVLGFDPGKVNFAWSVTDHVVTARYGMVSRVVESGMVRDLPEGMLGDMAVATRGFSNLATALHGKFAPDAVVAERFTASGLRVGTTIEISNMLAGVLAYECRLRYRPMHMVASVTWKNAFNNAAGDKEALKDVYRVCAATPHQVDASMLGCWLASDMVLCRPFESVSGDSLAPFLESIEATSTERLRNVRV